MKMRGSIGKENCQYFFGKISLSTKSFAIALLNELNLCYNNKRWSRKMKEQEYIIKKQESFQLKHIFECGQCFRWNKQEDGSYLGVVKNGVLKVSQRGETIIFQGKCEMDLQTFVSDYFDLSSDYDQMKEKLARIDDFMRISTTFGEGIRILHQDLWECIISFIISANNNIPRIKKIIEKISKQYGQKIEWNGQEYYTFPTPEELSKASIADLRACGLGFRDKRVFDTTQKILSKEIDLEEIQKIQDSRTNPRKTTKTRWCRTQSCRLHHAFFTQTIRRFSH